MGDAVPETASSWRRTLADLADRRASLEANGYEVATVPAGHLAAEPPEAGDSDRFGFVYVAPGDAAELFRAAFEEGTFRDYRVYRTVVGGTMYLLTELQDDAGEVAILLAGGVETAQLGPIRRAAREAGVVYSHVQLLDYTHLGSFRHERPGQFFPNE